ncbi:MAG TPA: CDP-alcohol phosphatidyltransferase family protein, partial [Gemmatimonadales bacterium]|nr:CDP-alcohol phosphatidyltransferase family protein [Gemmatimonadales bacterium]
MAAATRELTFFLAEPERRLLRALAARLPAAVSSDHLTALGVLGALGAGAAYALSRVSPGWLWVASAMLVVQWFGDSLDGTLARVRRAERPRYGYYLDHVVDAFSTAVIGLGIGLSPYVHLGAALGVVIVYLALSINVYLESAVLGVFRLAYNRIGPTEVRIIMVVANALLAVLSPVPSPMARTVATATLGILAVGMTGLLATRFARTLDALARLEPCGHATALESGRIETGPAMGHTAMH